MIKKDKIEILQLPLMATSQLCLGVSAVWVLSKYLFLLALFSYAGFDKPHFDPSPCAIAYLGSIFVVIAYNAIAKVCGGLTIAVSLKKSEPQR